MLCLRSCEYVGVGRALSGELVSSGASESVVARSVSIPKAQRNIGLSLSPVLEILQAE